MLFETLHEFCNVTHTYEKSSDISMSQNTSKGRESVSLFCLLREKNTWYN